jgi:hypothetical protein
MARKRVLLLGVVCTIVLSAVAGAETVAVSARPVALNASDPRQRVVGDLEYRGGLHLVSRHPRFGGLSSIRILADGQKLVAISDEGSWLAAALTEDWVDKDEIVGWTGGPDHWQRLGLRVGGPLRPSDAAALPDGDVLVLERAYDAARGIVDARIRLIPGGSIRPGATLSGRVVAEFAPPLVLDNYEGIAVARALNGETHVYMVSDDNFDRVKQRTLLLMFALRK